MGSQQGDVIRAGAGSSKDQLKAIVQAHGEGQLWALAVHPTLALFATGNQHFDCISQTVTLQAATTTPCECGTVNITPRYHAQT